MKTLLLQSVAVARALQGQLPVDLVALKRARRMIRARIAARAAETRADEKLLGQIEGRMLAIETAAQEPREHEKEN